MTKKIIAATTVFSAVFLASPIIVFAHCPLCTAGAGFLAVLASSIGVSTAGVGVFIGAFSLALGIWLAKMIKKKYLKYQDTLVALVVFLSTALPIMPFIREYRPLYIAMVGEYGTLLHNTYAINLYVLGVFIGALVLFAAPFISRTLVLLRKGKALPFQGLGITFGLLIATALLFQLIL